VEGNAGVSPTLEDQRYGAHETDLLDLWIVESDGPSPLVIMFPASGSDKSMFRDYPLSSIQRFLDAGVSVAAVTTGDVPEEAFGHADESLRYVVSNAAEIGIDPDRIATFGVSLGADVAMWLGFRDQPSLDSQFRIRAVGNHLGHSTLDVSEWPEIVPEFTDEDQVRLAESQGNPNLFDDPEVSRVGREFAAKVHLSPGDPPLAMLYRRPPGEPIPDFVPPEVRTQVLIHHASFGVELKELADRANVEARLLYEIGNESAYSNTDTFLIEKLLTD
jgi:hypothetical protein